MSEYWQFGLFMVFILAILAASYGFIIMAPSAPNREQKERQSERESEAD